MATSGNGAHAPSGVSGERNMQSELSGTYSESDIAIVGMALRAPGARDIHAFWDNLANGRSSIRRLSTEELEAAGEPASRYARPDYVPFAADLPDMEMFDADFFGLSPKEAAIMDPQHRHFLECAWEAMEDASRPPERMSGPVGVFAGCGMGSYFYFNLCARKDLVDQVGKFLLRHTGNDKDFLATRVSYTFDLQGPSVNVQTACSTSLVAIHYACQSLLSRECDTALAGGVTIELPHRRGYVFAKDEILSPDGCCRAFDHRAAGTVFGSGVGVVVLRRLADAIADGDAIHAVIKGTAVNNDGRTKASYLAPSVDGQAKAVLEAQGLAGVPADAIEYIECHGTGTPIGDPIEIEALTRAFRQGTDRKGFCRVGSVKTNIGHLDTAAGVVGLIKAALSLKHGAIAPTVGFEAPNPEIDFAASPFVVADGLIPWPARQTPRYAAVNSLGVGGTNAHAILQEAPPVQRPAAAAPTDAPQLIVLSARGRTALDAAARGLAAEIGQHPAETLPDVARSLFHGRRHFELRRVVAARSPADAAALLAGGDAKRVFTHSAAAPSGAVFLFPGGGAQHPGMARRLCEEDSSFRATIDEGLSYLEPSAARTIRDLWLGDGSLSPEAAATLLRPSLQLPAILIVEVALARFWMARGLRPAALIGHSMGENAAACVAGVLGFRDAVRLVRLRGELFDTVARGGMLSVVMSAAELKTRLPAELDLASVNAPDLCVVSGPDAALAAFQSALQTDGIDAVRVAIDIAAHSRMLDPILGRFEAFLRGLVLNAPAIPIVSNLTGDWLTDAEARDPAYWTRHLRSTVRFADGLATLTATPGRAFIEVGPGKTLSSLTKAQGSIDANLVINSLPHAEDADADDRAHLLAALGRAWATGVELRLDGLSERPQNPVRLPSYPFQHQRYFFDSVPAADRSEAALTRRADMAEWGYRPVWRQAAPAAWNGQGAPCRNWLIFLDDCGVGAAMAARISGEGGRVATVRASDQFSRRAAGDYTLCPEAGRSGYEALVSALRMDDLLPGRILHLWLLTGEESFRPGSSFFHRNQECGFQSMLHLAQAFGEHAGAETHVTLVTNGMQRVAGRRVRHPEKATVIGPARVIPRELPGFSVRMIDLELPPSPVDGVAIRAKRRLVSWLDHEAYRAGDARTATLDMLWDDVTAAPATETVAYADGRRWAQDYESVQLDRAEAGAACFRQEGVYLVTGGAGDLATVLCEDLARRFKARLVLFGRLRLPDRPFWGAYLKMQGAASRIGRAISAIERLEKLGAVVHYVSGDVSNPGDVRSAVEAGERVFGRIDGVIHAAGVVNDALIPMKTEASIESVVAPKVQGAANLAAVFADKPLDLFLLFSSTSVATAPAGQIDYVAANAYLDAFADSESHRVDRRTVAIQWGVWSEVGIAARAAFGSSADGEDGNGAEAARGPLFARWISDDGRRHLEGEWGPKTHWQLDEHRLAGGEAVWPGAGYLEVCAQAMLEHGLEGPFEIGNLEFLRPLHVEDGSTRIVRVALEPTQNGLRLEVTSASREAPEVFDLHAQAVIASAAPKPARAVDAAAIAKRCTDERRAAAGGALRAAQEAHLRFGPRWRVLRSIALGEGEAFATLELDPAFEHDRREGYRFPAGLLDIATGFAMELIPGYDAGESLWAPLSYGRARVYRDLPDRVRSWARLSGSAQGDGIASFDVTLMDEAGEVVLEVERLTVKRLGQRVSLVGAASPAGRRAPDRGARAGRQAAAPQLAEQVLNGIRPSEGAEALFRALGARTSLIVVSSMDLRALQRRAAAKPEATVSAGFERPDLDSEFVAPSTDVEIRLAGFWRELLGVEKIGVNDDFFDLGGHSLIAVRLFRMVREAFSVDLPISALFEAPTIAQCAALLGDASADGAASQNGSEVAGQTESADAAAAFLHVVSMNGQDRRGAAPFFLCAGMFGNVLNLRHLSLLVGADRPVYGLQARGLFGDLAPHETFEEMARDYCAEIRRIQPHGPYLLGGFSGGGLAAYAMARQLMAEGEDVAELVLLDTPLPRQTPLSYADLVAMKAQDFEREGRGYVFSWAARRARWEFDRIRGRLTRPEQAPADGFHNSVIEAAFYRALSRLEMRPYAGSTLLLRPKLDVFYRLSGGRRLDHNRYLLLEDNGWGDFAPGLTVVESPGDHDSMVLEPNVRVLAETLRARLRAADAGAVRLIAAE